MIPKQKPNTDIPAEHDMDELQRSIDRVKIRLMRHEVFFSALLTNLKLILDYSRPTAATDGISMWMNPNFIAPLDQDELLGLMLHEAMHVAFDHMSPMYREKNLNPKILNIAQDHYINLYITGLNYKIPQGGYCDPQFRGMSSMQIYHKLMEDPPPEAEDIELDVLGCPEDMSDMEHKETVNSNVIKAVLQAQISKAAGSVPGDVLLRLEDVLNPKLPWTTILWQYMDQYAKEDYSWRRPNKRFMPDFYLPCMFSEKMGGIFGVLDVSGSMMNDISECMAEMRYVKDMLDPEWFHLMTVDTEVHHDKRYEADEQLPTEELPDGGAGGTIIDPAIQRIIDEEPVFALIFTDGYFTMPDLTQVRSDLFWVIKGNPGFKAPEGVVIHMD